MKTNLIPAPPATEAGISLDSEEFGGTIRRQYKPRNKTGRIVMKRSSSLASMIVLCFLFTCAGSLRAQDDLQFNVPYACND